MTRSVLLTLALLAGCPSTPPHNGVRPPAPPAGAIQSFRDEPPAPGNGECRELGWSPPDYPAAYANPGCNNSDKFRCPADAVCCSYRCITGCVGQSDIGCPDYPICVEASRCRPGGRVDAASSTAPVK